MKVRSLFLPPPVRARHYIHSMLFSPEDDSSQPSAHLIDLAIKTTTQAIGIELKDVSSRMRTGPYWPDTWPGEHYRFLAALVKVLQPSKVIEIGTSTGLSALAMKKYLPPNGKLVTFDLSPWEKVPDTCLRPEDFEDGQLTQVLDDLSDARVMQKQAFLLRDAGLLFVDGPKDRRFEPKFLENLKMIDFQKAPYLVLDDIRTWNMLRVWRTIRAPKLDVTSLAHWTGTGLVHWT